MDNLYSQREYGIVEPIAVLRKRYLIICDNNCCAAFLLDRFYIDLTNWEEEQESLEEEDEPTFYYTMRRLARELFWIFDTETIHDAISFLIEKGYIRLEMGDCHEDIAIEYRHLGIACNRINIHKACKEYDAWIGNRYLPYCPTPTKIQPQDDDEEEIEEEDDENEEEEEEEIEYVFTPSPKVVKTEISQEERMERRESELIIVTRHNRRATKVGLDGTLTLAQWIEILDYFDWKCAYCQKKVYSMLEHFVPIIHGGGTTDTNCVPSCASCNGKKLNWNPLASYGPLAHMRADLDRVRQYLESRITSSVSGGLPA